MQRGLDVSDIKGDFPPLPSVCVYWKITCDGFGIPEKEPPSIRID